MPCRPELWRHAERGDRLTDTEPFGIHTNLFETRRGKVKVITEGVAVGQTVFCPEGHHTFEDPEWAGLPTHAWCSKLDGPGFLDLYRRTIVDGYRAA